MIEIWDCSRTQDFLQFDGRRINAGDLGRVACERARRARRAVDWAATPLGPVERWPQSLREAVALLIRSEAGAADNPPAAARVAAQPPPASSWRDEARYRALVEATTAIVWHADANAAVAGLADRLAVQRGTPVRAGFGTTEPRANDVLVELMATAEGPGTVVPLFVAPGLLLDGIAPTVAEAGWRMADPLGTLLAPLVSERYHAALGAEDRLR
jgi:hypothetical protein